MFTEYPATPRDMTSYFNRNGRPPGRTQTLCSPPLASSGIEGDQPQPRGRRSAAQALGATFPVNGSARNGRPSASFL